MNDSNTEHENDVLDTTPARVFVTGSDSFYLTNAFAQSLVDWWVNNDRPYTVLVVEDTVLGSTVASVWGRDKFPYETQPSPRPGRREERERRAQIILAGVTHAFIFEVGPEGQSWIDELDSHNIPWTRVTITSKHLMRG